MSGKASERLIQASLVVLAFASLSACVAAPKPTPQEEALLNKAQTGSILPATRAERDAADRTDLLSQAKFWSAEYDKNPNDAEAQVKFSRALRNIGSSQRANEVAAAGLAQHPGNYELAMVYAQASLDVGKPQDAAMALAPAEGAGQNDWRMLSLIGVTMDQLDKHKEARSYYERALALSPDNSKVLCNIGLSYALDNDPVSAEAALRKAAAAPNADPRVKQNLAIVLGVQGKFTEAEKVVADDSPQALVDSNTAYFKSLLTPARKWDKLRGASDE